VLVGVGVGVGVEMGVVVGMRRLTTDGVAVGTCVPMMLAFVFVLPLPGPMLNKITPIMTRKRKTNVPVAILAFMLHALNPSFLLLLCRF
jgi:hypothetical protein